MKAPPSSSPWIRRTNIAIIYFDQTERTEYSGISLYRMQRGRDILRPAADFRERDCLGGATPPPKSEHEDADLKIWSGLRQEGCSALLLLAAQHRIQGVTNEFCSSVVAELLTRQVGKDPLEEDGGRCRNGAHPNTLCENSVELPYNCGKKCLQKRSSVVDDDSTSTCPTCRWKHTEFTVGLPLSINAHSKTPRGLTSRPYRLECVEVSSHTVFCLSFLGVSQGSAVFPSGGCTRSCSERFTTS